MVLKRLFARKSSPVARPAQMPEGERIYAIGDIHGRLDLLDDLLALIDADDAARGASRSTLVFLGDLVDRGPSSRGVVERAMAIKASGRRCIFIAGNHEELLIRSWDGDRQIVPTFHRAGGRATLVSYGVDPDTYDSWDFDDVMQAVGRSVPAEHIAFLRGFDDWHVCGDYIFVHAGIRPGFAIEDQDTTDLRWIRGEFTRSSTDFGAIVIHGHTITEAVDLQANRIGIDTGAYASGMLTAIGLEGADRWFLQTGR